MDKEQLKKENKKQVKLKLEKNKSRDRARQTLFRNLSKNNYQLQQMIDRKSNILISINALIVSVFIGMIYLKKEFYVETLVSPALLAISCFISILFALIAIKPFHVSEKSLGWNSDYLLNYDAIKKMDINAYKSRVSIVIDSEELIYDSIIEDVFFIGQNIKIKHRFLSISAGVFVLGLGISIISFLIQSIE